MCKVFLRLLLISFCHLSPPHVVLPQVGNYDYHARHFDEKHCISAVVSVSSCSRDVKKAVVR